MMAEMAIRNMSPDKLVWKKVMARWKGHEGSTPVERKYPPELGGALAKLLKTSRPRMYRWLDDPDRNPLTWPELVEIAQEVGGNLRVMFSDRYR